MRALLTLSMLVLCGTGCPSDNSADDADLKIADLKMCAVDLYAHPVCGVDGKTYGNPELATVCANVAVAYDGPCHD